MGNSVGAPQLDERCYALNRYSYPTHNSAKQEANSKFRSQLDDNVLSSALKDKPKPYMVLPPADFTQSLKLRATRNGEILQAGGTISGRNDATAMHRSRTLICESRSKHHDNGSIQAKVPATNAAATPTSHKFQRSQTTLNISCTARNKDKENRQSIQQISNLEQMRVHSRSQPDFCAQRLLNATEQEQVENTATMLRPENATKYKKKRRAPAAPVEQPQQSSTTPEPVAQQPVNDLNARTHLYTTKKQQLQHNTRTNISSRVERMQPEANRTTPEIAARTKPTPSSKIPKLKRQFYFGMNSAPLPLTSQQIKPSNATSTSASDRFLDQLRLGSEEKFENGLRLHLRPTLPRRQQETPQFCPIVAWRSLLSAKPVPSDNVENELTVAHAEDPLQVHKHNWQHVKAATAYVPNVPPVNHDNSSSSSNNDNAAYEFLTIEQHNYSNNFFSLPKPSNRLHNDNWVLHRHSAMSSDVKLFEPLSLSSLTSNHVIYLPGHTNNLSTNIKSLTMLSAKSRQLPKDNFKEARRKEAGRDSLQRQTQQNVSNLWDKSTEEKKLSNHNELDVLTSVEEDLRRLRDTEKASIRQQLLHYLSKSRGESGIEQSINMDYNGNYNSTNCVESPIETNQLFIKNAKFKFTAN